VEINQQRKQEKEHRIPRKDLCNVGMWRTTPIEGFPHIQHDNRRVYNVQEETTVNDVARSMPRIYAVVEN
jgi:hypothetical protein